MYDFVVNFTTNLVVHGLDTKNCEIETPSEGTFRLSMLVLLKRIEELMTLCKLLELGRSFLHPLDNQCFNTFIGFRLRSK